jgi:hypothetical protein
MNNNYTYGTLIAKVIGEKITEEEGKVLEEWILADEKNMKLFEDLTNDFKSQWAKKWFAEAGVDTRFIKWPNREGWYKPEKRPLLNFYLVAALIIAGMALVYWVLKYI